MPETFTEVQHPQDVSYQMRRDRIIGDLLKLDERKLDKQLNWQLQQPAPRQEAGVTQKMLGELRNSQYIPPVVKGILDSTGGTTGNVLIRQDLEPTLYSLFVKVFPAWERLKKGPANGLVHAATQITSPDTTNALGATTIAELGSVNYVSSGYARATFPIAVFATGRGVGFKEMAAVAQGGAPYDPSKTELANGMIKLAQDIQYTIFQGNASTSGGAGSATELGAFNANAFDGLRSVIGSVGTYTGNNAIQLDIGSLNMLESIQVAAAKAANNGGMPSAVLMSYNSKQALDIEQQNQRRYAEDTIEIVPGLRVSQVAWANGQLVIIPVPGTTMGTYNRTSDNALVEDMYVLDESTITVRWLYSEGFTVLQIPSGVDGVLSERFILFGMYGLELAAPPFNAKARRLAA